MIKDGMVNSLLYQFVKEPPCAGENLDTAQVTSILSDRAGVKMENLSNLGGFEGFAISIRKVDVFNHFWASYSMRGFQNKTN